VGVTDPSTVSVGSKVAVLEGVSVTVAVGSMVGVQVAGSVREATTVGDAGVVVIPGI
jgi:hypothetical protein